MEFNEVMTEYKKHNPREFFNWASKGRTMEIRFLNSYAREKFKDFWLIEKIAKNIGVAHRFNSLFINTYDELEKILLYKVQGRCATKLYNIYIGVNPRRKVQLKSKNGLFYKNYYGGIAGTSHIQNILCDIEHKDREGSATLEQLKECFDAARFLVKELELEDYYINCSSNGSHLWFRLNPELELPEVKFDEFKDKIKFRLKEEPILGFIKNYNRFIEHLNELLQKYNPKLKVDDGAKDLSRIARAPGSWNVKRDKIPRAVGTVEKQSKLNNNINSKYTAVKTLINPETKIKLDRSKNYRYNLQTIEKCPLIQLFLSRNLPSIVSRNHYLEQSLARILRDNDINLINIQPLLDKINIIQNKTIQCDPDYLGDDTPFNSETINAYCYLSNIDFVYPVLEEVPIIQDKEEFIDDLRFARWESMSDDTVNRMGMDLEIKDDYIELKNRIRSMVDNNVSKSMIFFALKKSLKNKWPYLVKNRIVLDLLNKTRKRIS